MKRNLFFLCILAVALALTACSKDEPSINTNYLKVVHSTLGKNYEEAVGVLSANGLLLYSESGSSDDLIEYIGYSQDTTYVVAGELYLSDGAVKGYSVSCAFWGKEYEEKARKIVQKWSDYSYNTIFKANTCWEATTNATMYLPDYDCDYTLYKDGPCVAEQEEATKKAYAAGELDEWYYQLYMAAYSNTHKLYRQFLDNEFNLNEHRIEEYFGTDHEPISARLSAFGPTDDGQKDYEIDFDYPYLELIDQYESAPLIEYR